MKANIITVILIGILSGCSDFLDRTPVDFPTEDKFYTDVKGLEGAVIGTYDALQSSGQYGNRFLNLMEVRGDNVQDDNSGASGGSELSDRGVYRNAVQYEYLRRMALHLPDDLQVQPDSSKRRSD